MSSKVWKFINTKNDPHSIRFYLKDNEDTRALWEHSFQLIYDLQLLESNKLHISLQVLNTGHSEFDFNLLFHPYFKVDVENLIIDGLTGLNYIDKTDNFTLKTETRKAVIINKFTDYVYNDTPPVQVLTDGKKRLQIWKSDTLPNTVVWNPHQFWTKHNLAEGEAKTYVCVEGGAVSNKIQLPPGNSWKCSMLLTPGGV